MAEYFTVIIYQQEENIKTSKTEKRENRGIGLGIKLPADCIFYGENRGVKMVERAIGKAQRKTDERVKRCLK